MTQHTGKELATGTEVVAPAVSAPRSKTLKNFSRTVAAAALSVGMVGVFALPANAVSDAVVIPDGAPAQQLVTEDVAAATLPLEGPTAEIDQVSIEREAAEAAAREAEERQAVQAAEAKTQADSNKADVPAGAGAAGMVNGALAQLGQAQDCTALVERSLRAIGFNVGDLGTSIGEYARFGTVVTSGGYAPGDILIWPGAHVAIYIGNGQAVHGGMNGTTMVYSASGTMLGAPSAAVRIG